jgi:hypothetical protein
VEGKNAATTVVASDEPSPSMKKARDAVAGSPGARKVVRPASDRPEPPQKEASGAKTRFAHPNDASSDCGTCKYCLDKPKNGGPNTLRRACINQRLGKAIDKATQQGPNNVAEPVETSRGAGATPATDAFGDCGTCKNCLDKRRYGGPGTLRQICVLKLAAKAAANPSRTLAMLSTKTGAVQTGPEPKLVPLAEAETDGTTLAIRLSSYKPEPSVTEASGAATLFVSNGLEDCGTCKFCLDKRKNGGPNKWRKACENRRS